MNLWHSEDAREIAGAQNTLSGNLKAISGNSTCIWGHSFISGDVSWLQGCVTGLRGSCDGLTGVVGRLRGDITGITGCVDERLIGNVSGLHGDVTGVWGKADGLFGTVRELLDQGMLWPANQSLSLELFASRNNLPMEFFDNSGLPALVAFHALEDISLHWVTVRSGNAEAFAAGPLAVVSQRFPGQEIIKVAIPGDADWQLSEDYDMLRTDRIYAFEQSASPVHAAVT